MTSQFHAAQHGSSEQSKSVDDARQSIESYVPTRIEETEIILAKALGSLSVQERSQVYEDVHGVSKPIEEDPAFVSQSLAALDDEISVQKTGIYEKALVQNRTYVEDSALRLMFLRSEYFNVGAAAKRLMSFLKQKAAYFGEEKLTKEITLQDFSEDDVRSLESGAIQILPEADRSGRVVIAIFPFLRNYTIPENLLRTSFYMEMHLLRDKEVQRKGAVYIYYNTNPNRPGLTKNHSTIVARAKQHKEAMPMRYASFHTCLHERKGLASIGYVMSRSKQDLVKGNSHYGNDEECLLDLKRFGIPVASFPVDIDGNMHLQNHQRWLQKRKMDLTLSLSLLANLPETNSPTVSGSTIKSDDSQEFVLADEFYTNHSAGKAAISSTSPDLNALARAAADMGPNSIIQPTVADVLLGRGRCFQEFPGNVQFRNYLECGAFKYDNADRVGKMEITNFLVASLQASGTRFLRLTPSVNGDDAWEEVSSKEVYKKVSQFYRTVRKKEKA